MQLTKYIVTEDQQIEFMKTNLQTSGQLTGLLVKPYDFYRQTDVADFLKYLTGRYSEHTARCYVNYHDNIIGRLIVRQSKLLNPQ